MATKLSVNINKIATLRNTRPGHAPAPERFAALALEAGAHGITVHPRPDERHIRAADVQELTKLLAQPTFRGRGVEFNIEGNPFEGQWVSIVEQARPDQATLVPDSVEQATSDHGFSATPESVANLKPMVAQLQSFGCQVSLFMDADPKAISAIAETGCNRVELYTEPYAKAFRQGGAALQQSLNQFAEAAQAATAAGLGINAGHDLSLENLPAFLEHVPGVQEVSIGHALIAEALELGFSETVRRYLAICA